MSTRNDLDQADAQSPARRGPAPVPPRPSISPSDPAVQVLDSAYQILTMIGANPRAMRPIVSQRRLTKETILEAAASVGARAAAALAELDRIEAARRAAYEAAVNQARAEIDALTGGQPTAVDDAGERARLADLQGRLDSANAAWARFEAEQRRHRAYLTSLRDRAAHVAEVYQAL